MMQVSASTEAPGEGVCDTGSSSRGCSLGRLRPDPDGAISWPVWCHRRCYLYDGTVCAPAYGVQHQQKVSYFLPLQPDLALKDRLKKVSGKLGTHIYRCTFCTSVTRHLWGCCEAHDHYTCRYGLLAGAAFCNGFVVGPLVDMALGLHPAMVLTAFLATASIFACFSGAGMSTSMSLITYCNPSCLPGFLSCRAISVHHPCHLFQPWSILVAAPSATLIRKVCCFHGILGTPQGVSKPRHAEAYPTQGTVRLGVHSPARMHTESPWIEKLPRFSYHPAMRCSDDGEAQELAVPGRHAVQRHQRHDGHAPGHLVLWWPRPHVPGVCPRRPLLHTCAGSEPMAGLSCGSSAPACDRTLSLEAVRHLQLPCTSQAAGKHM